MQIANTNWMTASDERGCFSFSDIPNGDFILVASHIGYETTELPLDVIEDMTVNVNVSLKVKMIALPPVTVETEISLVKVYDSEVIKSSTAENLGDFLHQQSEALILDSGGSREARISLRGSRPEQVAVYFDGHRLNDPRTGEVDLRSILLSNVERIEVRSNSDLKSGASSPGGSIEVFSTEVNRASTKLSFGSFGSETYEIGLGKIWRNSHFSFSFSRVSSKGNFPYHDANQVEKIRQNDDYLGDNLFLKYVRTFPNSNLTVSFHHLVSERGAPGGMENPATLDRINRNLEGIALNFNSQKNNWQNQTRASYYITTTENQSYYFYAGDTIDFRSHHRSMALEFDSHWTRTDIWGNYNLGSAYRFDGVSSSSFSKSENRQDLGLYFQRAISIQRIHLINCIRGDSYRGYGNFISSSFSFRLEHLIWKQLSLSANWSRSFNLPTFNQLFWAENAFAQPNPDLDPEKGESFDLGMEFNNSKLRSRIVCFQRFIKDMIIWQETYTNSGKKWKPINTDAALIRGIELYCQFASKILTLTSNAILSDPRNKTQDYYNQYLVFQPAVQTSVALTLKFHNWNLTLSHRYLSRRYILQANTKWLSPVTLFDLSLGNDFKYQNWNCMLILRLNNIFNEEYQVISNSPMPGRNYIVSFCCFKE